MILNVRGVRCRTTLEGMVENLRLYGIRTSRSFPVLVIHDPSSYFPLSCSMDSYPSCVSEIEPHTIITRAVFGEASFFYPLTYIARNVGIIRQKASLHKTRSPSLNYLSRTRLGFEP